MKPYYDEGGVTIYHGDCRDLLPDLAADVVITDPPFGIDHSFTGGLTRKGGRAVNGGPGHGRPIMGDQDTSLRDEILLWWGDRPALVFGTWKTPSPKGTRAVLTWDKGDWVGMGDLSLPWKPNTEEVYVLGRGFVGKRGTSVLRFPGLNSYQSQGVQVHPTQKPVELLRFLISRCPPEWTVLDPFMGSGTTLRAAKDLGRRAIGIELEERYCEVAVKRLGQEVLAL